jgi:hypothetical protein
MVRMVFWLLVVVGPGRSVVFLVVVPYHYLQHPPKPLVNCPTKI